MVFFVWDKLLFDEMFFGVLSALMITLFFFTRKMDPFIYD